MGRINGEELLRARRGENNEVSQTRLEIVFFVSPVCAIGACAPPHNAGVANNQVGMVLA